MHRRFPIIIALWFIAVVGRVLVAVVVDVSNIMLRRVIKFVVRGIETLSTIF